MGYLHSIISEYEVDLTSELMELTNAMGPSAKFPPGTKSNELSQLFCVSTYIVEGLIRLVMRLLLS